MGNNRTHAIGPARLITIAAAIGMLAAGLALSGANPLGGLTFRDVVYSHHVKLTGVVVGKGTMGKPPHLASVISIRKGKKKVGKWLLSGGSCIGSFGHSECTMGGSGKMKIGSLKGKVKISVHCLHNFQGKTSYTGTLSGAGTSEVLSFKRCPPGGGIKKGTKFKFTLSY